MYKHHSKNSKKPSHKKNRCSTNHKNQPSSTPALSAPSFPALAKAKESKTWPFLSGCFVKVKLRVFMRMWISLGGGALGIEYDQKLELCQSLTNKVCFQTHVS